VLFVSSFAMITYSVGTDKVRGLEEPLEEDELSVRVGKGFEEL